MKYLAYSISVVLVLFIIGCEPITETYYYDYLTMINCDGTNKIQLTDYSAGHSIFYDNNSKILHKTKISYPYDQIVSLDLNTLSINTILPTDTTNYDISDFELFPNLNKIIFWGPTSIDCDIYLGSIESGTVEVLTNTDSIVEGYVKPSPNYEYFAYIQKHYFELPDSVLWSLKFRNLDGYIDVVVDSEFSSENSYSSVDWIDENTLIYVNGKYFSEPGIYVINTDGTNNQYIYEGFLIQLSMCEDRSKVVFEDDDEIYLLNTSNYSVSHLFSGTFPKISPDGNKLAYIDEFSKFMVWDMVTDQITLLSETPASSARSFTSDSQKLVFNETIEVTYTSGRDVLD